MDDKCRKDFLAAVTGIAAFAAKLIPSAVLLTANVSIVSLYSQNYVRFVSMQKNKKSATWQKR